VAESPIAAGDHVAIRVTDLEDALRTATTIMGLREVERTAEWVFLTHGTEHHSLQLAVGPMPGLDHVGLLAADEDALAEIGRLVSQDGLVVLSDTPLDSAGVETGIAFVGPEGFVFEVIAGMQKGQPPYAATGVRPRRFGHVNFYAREPGELVEFFQRVLGFRVSDYVGPGAFLRCNADHHGVGIGPADRSRLHHIAWEVESIAELARLGDALDDAGRHLLWGPVRHGVGRNIAAYFLGFDGLVVEYYADMQRIDDEAGFEPGRWSRDDPRFPSVWARHDLGDFRSHGLAPAERS
jgi:catechol 2,3-dioxygenase-like lactoylglutathione lyase family enzyme